MDVVDDDLAVVFIPLEATLAAPAYLADILVVFPQLIPSELAVGGSANEDATAKLGQVRRARALLLQVGTCVSYMLATCVFTFISRLLFLFFFFFSQGWFFWKHKT